MTPEESRNELKKLSDKAGELMPKFESGDFTRRDMAVLLELGQRYVDILSEIKDTIDAAI